MVDEEINAGSVPVNVQSPVVGAEREVTVDGEQMTVPAPNHPKKEDKKQTFGNFLVGNIQQNGIILALILLLVIFSIVTSGNLLLPNSFVDILNQNAYVFVVAMGMVMVIIATHIDLSVGSVIAFGGIISAASIMWWGMPWYVGVLVGIAVGFLAGAFHGFFIAYVGIPGFITTLAGMLIFRGLAIIVGGNSVSLTGEDGTLYNKISSGFVPNFLGFIDSGINLGAGGLGLFPGQIYLTMDVVTLVVGALIALFILYSTFSKVAKSKKLHPNQPGFINAWNIVVGIILAIVVLIVFVLISASGANPNDPAQHMASNNGGGIPFSLIIIGVLGVVYTFITNRTIFGRYVYAVGGNRKAAILTGINTKLVDFKIYLHTGFLVGIAAVLTTARLGSAQPAAGDGYELDVIAACFVGGTAVTGGIGTVPGTMIGTIIFAIISRSLALLSVPTAWVKVIKGLILLIAVVLDLTTKKSKK